jgi:GNAT superfamily N-acetyltransferase
MTPLLRAATIDDATRIADLLIDTRKAFMPYAPSAHTEAEVRAWVASKLVPAGGVVVAEVDGTVVGAMAVAAAAGVSWINQMATHLLARAIGILKPPIRLWTFQQNTGARRFYERNGFVAIEFTDGQGNEERCPDVLYEFGTSRTGA